MEWIWWLIGIFGVTGTLLVVAGVFLGWPVLLQIFLRYWKIIVPVAAALLALFGAYHKGKSKGRAAEIAKAKKIHAKNVKIAADEKMASDKRTEAEVRNRLKDRRRK